MSHKETAPGQLPLPFARFDRFEFDQYRPGVNEQVIQYLMRLISGQERQPVFIWGEKTTGKSHLLQAVCTRASSLSKRVAYIPLLQHLTLSPALLEGLDQMDIVCIDDLHEIAGKEEWELAVFNLFNALYDAKKPPVLAADASPKGLAIELADLKSRLTWGVTFHLKPLDEDERFQALRQRAELRGLVLSDEITAYLARRVPRDMQTLLDFLDKLDEASLVAKKKLTIPFIRELLERNNN